jgi:DNA-binding FrmR family transcriptional regulator
MEDKKIVTRKEIQTRLRRIEGQIKGISKMVENEVCCRDILIQIAAARAAMNKVGGIIMENYAKGCFECEEDSKNAERIEELVSTVTMFLK